jgi:starch synthase
MKKILFVTSEAYPLIKTGGLADVSSSLPKALAELGQDVRLMMPNYQAVNSQGDKRWLGSLRIYNSDVSIFETFLPGSEVKVWLVDCPNFFDYPGNPYTDAEGIAWPNNDERFALFCHVAAACAMDTINLGWKPDIVHCNDWQSGLVPALLSLEDERPATVFTIHNMAYQGLFPANRVTSLNLPRKLWHQDGLEFFNMLSFLKGGLAYADRITTVSPTYAQEIQTAAFGYGFEGLLAHRSEDLIGIINGIDEQEWNPDTDHLIRQTFNADSLDAKQANKAALQERSGLPVNDEIPVFALISRLVEQKGIDMLLDCLPEILALPVQVIILGSGDKGFEQQLQALAELHPEKMSLSLAYDEGLAHAIEAGADVFLMPSRFEPCGLNQMYSQRYGTIPIVRKTGGLADTVVDALPETLANGSATGLVFTEASAGALMEAFKRALLLYHNPTLWAAMQKNAMRKDFSWRRSAEQYLTLYDGIFLA